MFLDLLFLCYLVCSCLAPVLFLVTLVKGQDVLLT